MINKIYLDTTNIDLPNAIKEGLLRNGINQLELANMMGVAHSSVNRWITGKRKPNSDAVMSLVMSGIINLDDAKKNPCEDRKS